MKRVFRKKPVQIEAIQISDSSSDEVRRWSDGKVYASPICEPTKDNPSGHYWQINTLEGIMTAIVGDWIIKGVKGEFYPCKNDIFMMTYEPIEDLPESKPEPKNCGNCGRYTSFCCPTLNSPAEDYSCWREKEQPKAAEPQGWEQRFDKEFPHCGGAFKTSLRAFIRAEIEVAEKRGFSQGMKNAYEDIKHKAELCIEEQNKHREIK